MIVWSLGAGVFREVEAFGLGFLCRLVCAAFEDFGCVSVLDSFCCYLLDLSSTSTVRLVCSFG